jgi:hypothetical protein
MILMFYIMHGKDFSDYKQEARVPYFIRRLCDV